LVAYAHFVFERFSRFNGQFGILKDTEEDDKEKEEEDIVMDELKFLVSASKVIDRALEV
jgi:hypothetical protein